MISQEELDYQDLQHFLIVFSALDFQNPEHRDFAIIQAQQLPPCGYTLELVKCLGELDGVLTKNLPYYRLTEVTERLAYLLQVLHVMLGLPDYCDILD